MKGQLQCHNCGYGIHVEGLHDGDDVFCPNCGVTIEDVTQDDLL